MPDWDKEAARTAIGFRPGQIPPGEWRTIDSAPKDGSHFLACCAKPPYDQHWTFDQRPPTVVHWWGNPGEEGFYFSVSENEPQHPFAATHWMPLPSAPIGGRTDGG